MERIAGYGPEGFRLRDHNPGRDILINDESNQHIQVGRKMNIFQEGIRLYKEGKYSQAVEKLYGVASADQHNHKAWNALGVALSRVGDLDQSIICFENARSLDPVNETYKKNLDKAKARKFQGKTSVPIELISSFPQEKKIVPLPGQGVTQWPVTDGTATTDASSTLSQNADDNSQISQEFLSRALSLFGQASYHEVPGLMKEALEYVDKALEKKPDFFEAWQLKASIYSEMSSDNPQYLTDALSACDRALSINPDQASTWFSKAGILERLGRYDDAVIAYDRAYSYSASEPMRLGIILMKKGAALEATGNESLAQKTYEQVPVTDRFFGEAMEKKAAYLEKTGNRTAAVSTYRTAGMSHLKQEQYYRAIDSFRYLLSLMPDDEEALYNIGAASLSLYEQTQERRFLEDALVSFDSVLKKDPENVTYLIQKGRCLLDLGRYEEGLQYLDRALWINPGDGITLMNKGIALYQLSRHDEAIRYFDLVITNYPEHSAAWLMKSRIHMEARLFDIALNEIDQALKISPDDSRCWEQKVVILRALGREDEARKAEDMIQNEI